MKTVAEHIELSPEELARYSRHLTLPEVGKAGQEKLKAGSVLLVGAGGLGSPLAMYLAAAGVGRIGLVDFDVVDQSNLHRQVLHGTSAVGRPKLESARARIEDLNPHVEVDTYETALTSENAFEIIEPYDIVIDGTDNFPTRYLVNDACVLLGKPNVYGSIFRFEGQASFFDAARGPCYRCLFPEPPPPGAVPSCAEGGVLGVLPGIIGTIQATEGIKYLLGVGELLIGRLLLFDALQMSFRQLKVKKHPACPLCGENRTITELIDYEQFCGVGRENEMHDELPEEAIIEVTELKARLDRGDDVLLIDVREEEEYAICRIPGAQLIPLGAFRERHHELPRDADIVIHCKMGGRSAQAVHLLRQAGHTRVQNLAGGIHAWADEIDPSVPKY